MNVIKNERVIPCDIDETLVHHEFPKSYAKQIIVEDPLEPGQLIELGVNLPMVKILKDEYFRGAKIIVWSRSGYAWAETIMKALGLDHLDFDVYTKPHIYLDDKDVGEWLKDRVFIDSKTIYKQHISKGAK